MKKETLKSKKLIYNPNPKPKVAIDETPTGLETFLGLAFGVGYLTIFTVIPYFIFIIYFPGLLSETLAASLAQIIAAIFTVFMMFLISRRVISKVLKGFSFDSLKLGLSYAGIMYLISIIYGLIDLYIFKNNTVNTNQQELMKIAAENRIVFLALAVIVAPIIEELIFRYYIYKPLEKKGFVLATLVSTILFSVIHIIPSLATNTLATDIWTLPAYLLPSLVFAFAYYNTKKLAVPVFAHFAFNLVSAIVILFPIAV